MLKSKIITNTKSDFKYTMDFNGYIFDYGAGGIHQCIETGIYKAEGTIIIKDLDVASLYPSIACMNNMFPAHLGVEFFQVYKEDIVDVRLAEKAKPNGNH
jgi:DNA polymerase elongation subunit (family B)